MDGKENNFENASIVSFLLLTHTYRSMKVADDRMILKCGRRVVEEVVHSGGRSLTSGFLYIILLHFHYYQCCHFYSFLLFVGKLYGQSDQTTW
jgi:hypothetical protein